jgi:altronate dehydratase small subunit
MARNGSHSDHSLDSMPASAVQFLLSCEGLWAYLGNQMPEIMEPTIDARLLRLTPADNVLTVISTLEAGEEIWVNGRQVRVPVRLPLGHKVAARDIAAGEKIIKYGVPIGSATQAIPAGAHVHTHNLKSDYLPTYTWAEQGEYFAKHH